MSDRILLVEDDQNLADGIQMMLEASKFEVVHLSHGENVLDEIRGQAFDLILMDIMLPGEDGLTLCRKIRADGNKVPILFLTARGDVDDRVEGLLSGGDDYITKPFDMRELIARIKGTLRRRAWETAPEATTDSYEFDGRTIDFKSFEASGPGGSVVLTKKECLVLKYLIEREGEVVRRDQILDAVWGYNEYPSSRTVDNFVLRFRKIFEDHPNKPVYFESIYGTGYRFSGSAKD